MGGVGGVERERRLLLSFSLLFFLASLSLSFPGLITKFVFRNLFRKHRRKGGEGPVAVGLPPWREPPQRAEKKKSFFSLFFFWFLLLAREIFPPSLIFLKSRLRKNSAIHLPHSKSRLSGQAQAKTLHPSLYLPRVTGSNPDTAVTATMIATSTTPPAITDCTRFLSEGVTSAWAASGEASAAPTAAVTPAGISRENCLRSALLVSSCVNRIKKRERKVRSWIGRRLEKNFDRLFGRRLFAFWALSFFGRQTAPCCSSSSPCVLATGSALASPATRRRQREEYEPRRKRKASLNDEVARRRAQRVRREREKKKRPKAGRRRGARPIDDESRRQKKKTLSPPAPARRAGRFGFFRTWQRP